MCPSSSLRYKQPIFLGPTSPVWLAPLPVIGTRALTWQPGLFWASPKHMHSCSPVLFSSCPVPFPSPVTASYSRTCCQGSLYPTEDISELPRTSPHFSEAVRPFVKLLTPIRIWWLWNVTSFLAYPAASASVLPSSIISQLRIYSS